MTFGQMTEEQRLDSKCPPSKTFMSLPCFLRQAGHLSRARWAAHLLQEVFLELYPQGRLDLSHTPLYSRLQLLPALSRWVFQGSVSPHQTTSNLRADTRLVDAPYITEVLA